MKVVPFEEYPDVRSIAVRVAPIDVGWDLRAEGRVVLIPRDTDRASYAVDGVRYVVTGTAAEVAATLRRAGYKVRLT